MKSVLVTGCNRGIGLALVKQLVKTSSIVLATCRDSNRAAELCEIGKKHSNLHILNIDMTHFDKYPELYKSIENIVKEEGINVLFNNAGITTKFTRIQQVKIQQLMDNYTINTVAPLMLVKECLPFLKKAAQKASGLTGVNRAAVVNISSVLGSIQDNTEGGFYPYRTSKSALNAVTKSLSVDLRKDNILAVSMHPGWCKTDMGGKNAPLEVDAAVCQMLQTLNSLTDNDSGIFLQYDGKVIPW